MKLKTAPPSRLVFELDLDESDLFPDAIVEFKLKRILVPVDFSPLSRKALHYALAFARQFKAEILLLHAVVPLPPGPEYQVASALQNTELHEQAASRLARWRKAVALQASVKAKVLDGPPHLEIIRAAAENSIDLIIIGMHGRKGLVNYLLGSTARRVVRQAPCPVLVVRDHEHDFLSQSAARKSSSKRLKPLTARRLSRSQRQ
jgi:universal stress protein A